MDFPGLRNGMGGGGGKGGRELDPSPRDVGVDGPASAELDAIVGQIGRRPSLNHHKSILHPVSSSHKSRTGIWAILVIVRSIPQKPSPHAFCREA